MASTLIASYLLSLASISDGQLSTLYGTGERFCGDTHAPANCSAGAITASGEAFDPTKPTAAIPLPANHRLRKGFLVHLRHGETGPCTPIWVNDKKNARYRGKHNFDLTPAAVHAITGKYPTKYWSSKEVLLCPYMSSSAPIAMPLLTKFASQFVQNMLSSVPYAPLSSLEP